MNVLLFTGKRLLALAVTLIIASVLIFLAFALTPGDPAAVLAGGSRPDAQTLAEIRHQFHLDAPLWQRYLIWVGGLLTGDLGESFVYRTPVADLIGPRLETTLVLTSYAALLILVFGVGSGIVAALSGRIADRTVTIAGSILMGAPTFVVAMFLIWLFSQQLDWFPVYGSGTGLADMLWHLTLPAVAMSCAYLAFLSRITRSAIRGQLYSEHVETATSRGVRRSAVVIRHVLRNASPEILAVSGITLAGLIASTAVAETAFGVSGIGSLLVQAAGRKDLPVVLVVSLIMVVAFVVINTVVDLVNVAIDPRLAQRRTA
ncbi:ABC transporter permease [Leifsonia aquatica]|jgi:peptide/nickel transport system permease protein|uniref:Peptide/nickel transport system permease protein n=2 Tax=Leifsonia aquatica TaxID=144185 RepID=A0A7W4YKA1_LEIAQ|nr:ABC transporter permease [Leifsonia aquatica]ERK69773.1 putative glutathione ABC transporter, permease protein GsiC [Leifsonia aquatica ATCC 14665]MBB2968916.1 peptide/nickel transport system permease protein [Leifsonia aquatica]